MAFQLVLTPIFLLRIRSSYARNITSQNSMAKEDWAVIVGIRHYPGIGDLDGPENDATAFYDWAISTAGGDIPKDQVVKIVSGDFKLPAKSARFGQPTIMHLQQEFDRFEEVADKNSEAGNGRKAGRRLYVFLAGHAYAPTLDEIALLMANATKSNIHHFAGRAYADWFYSSGFFSEVLLFMDCCRENYRKAPVIPPPYVQITGPEVVDKGKRFYGFATKWTKLSRETVIQGRVQGVFTASLMAGLQGGASVGDRITTSSLKSYLIENMKNFLPQSDLDNPDIPREPDIYDPNEFVIVDNIPAPLFPVKIHIPSGYSGKEIKIVSGMKLATVESTIATSKIWRVKLPRGIYLALTDGLETRFEVTGVGEVNVNF
jgi:hypothetical protein